MVSEEFPPYEFGGVATVCHDLAVNLAKKGIETTVLCGSGGLGSRETRAGNLEIVRLPILDWLPPRPFWFQIQNLGRLSRLLRDVDIFHAVKQTAAAIPMYLGRKLEVPCITHIHGTARGTLSTLVNAPLRYITAEDIFVHLGEYPLKEFLSRLFINASDHFIVCSQNTLREFRSYYRDIPEERFTVISNGINLESIDDLKSESAVTEPPGHSIMFYGQFIWRKGLTYLIKSFKILQRTIPDAVLDMYGTGPMESTVRNLVQELGLKTAVNLRGHVSRPELIRGLKSCDLVVLPSLYEAQSVAALEAMAFRKPLIAFDTPSSRELIAHMSNGVLARARDIEDLSRKMELVLGDRDLAKRLGENARRYVEKYHNWDSLVESYIALYESLSRR